MLTSTNIQRAPPSTTKLINLEASSHLATVISALSNEVIRDSFGCPSELGQTRVDFLVQGPDSFSEQSTLFRGQNSDDPENRTQQKVNHLHVQQLFLGRKTYHTLGIINTI